MIEHNTMVASSSLSAWPAWHTSGYAKVAASLRPSEYSEGNSEEILQEWLKECLPSQSSTLWQFLLASILEKPSVLGSSIQHQRGRPTETERIWNGRSADKQMTSDTERFYGIVYENHARRVFHVLRWLLCGLSIIARNNTYEFRQTGEHRGCHNLTLRHIAFNLPLR